MPPCQPLAESANVNLTVTKNESGGYALYSCNVGFKPVNDKSVFTKMCYPNGTWIPTEVPQCTVVTCSVPVAEEHSHFVNFDKSVTKYYFDEKVEMKCNKGAQSLYIEPGTEETPLKSIKKSCSELGSWTKEQLTCLLVQCESPPSYEIADYRLINSSSTVSTLLYDMIITFECDWTRGFEPTENQTSKLASWHCNENSTWDKQDLKCSQSSLLKSLAGGSAQQVYESDSAAATATVILVVIGMFFAVIVCLDYMTIEREIRLIRRNFGQFTRLLRDRTRVKQLKDLRNLWKNKVRNEIRMKAIVESMEKHQLASAGLGTVSFDQPSQGLAHLTSSDRVMSAARQRNSDHVDGEMEMPENEKFQGED